MLFGYYMGYLYIQGYDSAKRKGTLAMLGFGAIILFVFLRVNDWYGDPVKWTVQETPFGTLMSFFNLAKYPPSLLYTLMTLGPAFIFLYVFEDKRSSFLSKIVVIGRVPMFFYLAHILLIHAVASIAGVITGYPEMVVLNHTINDVPELKGYGFNLAVVYFVWITFVVMLYPCCQWYDQVKRKHQSTYRWLSYL